MGPVHRRCHGWHYNAGLNAIVFDGFAVPQERKSYLAIFYGLEQRFSGGSSRRRGIMFPPLILPLLSCKGQSEGLMAGDITTIRIEPAELSLVTRPDEPAVAEFAAFATMKDGAEIEMDLISWSLSNLSTGEICDDVFCTADTNGESLTLLSFLGSRRFGSLKVTFSTDI